MEFEWKILPGFKTPAFLKEIQNKTGELQCDPADFKDRIIFMSMFNDSEWEARGNEELCENNREKWSFLGHGSDKKSRTELSMACQVGIGHKQRRKCC